MTCARPRAWCSRPACRARARRSPPSTRSRNRGPPSCCPRSRWLRRPWTRSRVPMRPCWSPSGPGSPSSTGPRSHGGWRTRCSSTGATSSIRRRSGTPASRTKRSGDPARETARWWAEVQALILAGGEGTRLRPLTYTVPKPVLPLVGRPHIAYVIDWLVRHGVDDVIVSCGHLAEGMRQAIAELKPGVEISYAEEPDARGTAGAIRFAEDLLGDRFLVLNGDVLCDLDLTAL